MANVYSWILDGSVNSIKSIQFSRTSYLSWSCPALCYPPPIVLHAQHSTHQRRRKVSASSVCWAGASLWRCVNWTKRENMRPFEFRMVNGAFASRNDMQTIWRDDDIWYLLCSFSVQLFPNTRRIKIRLINDRIRLWGVCIKQCYGRSEYLRPIKDYACTKTIWIEMSECRNVGWSEEMLIF